MTTFAHIEAGPALDPVVAENANAYLALFTTQITEHWQVQAVPDGTAHGATPNGDGTWTNPTIPQPVAQPKSLSGTEFHSYCAAAMAQAHSYSETEGLARMGDIIGAAGAVQGGLVRIAYERYKAASVPGGRFELSEVAKLLEALRLASIVTPEEEAAIVTGWPTTTA